jgi:hypothetical protein
MNTIYSSEVAAAEAEAREAEALANSLEDAIRSGDTTITPDELTKQRSLVGFLRLQVDGARAKARAREVQARDDAIKRLRDEILAKAPESGEQLVKLLLDADKASRAFYDASLAHDSQLAAWVARIEGFRIGAGQQEHGVGLNGIKQIVVGGIVLDQSAGANHLNKLYVGNSDPYGKLIPSADDSGRVQETVKALRSIGKAA